MLAAGATAIQLFPTDTVIVQVYGSTLSGSPTDFLQAYLTVVGKCLCWRSNGYGIYQELDEKMREKGTIDFLQGVMDSGEPKSMR